MSHSFGEGYATRSDEEGFGGIYGGNRSDDDDTEGKNGVIHENHPGNYMHLSFSRSKPWRNVVSCGIWQMWLVRLNDVWYVFLFLNVKNMIKAKGAKWRRRRILAIKLMQIDERALLAGSLCCSVTILYFFFLVSCVWKFSLLLL